MGIDRERLLIAALRAAHRSTWQDRVEGICEAVALSIDGTVSCLFLDLTDGTFEQVYPRGVERRLPYTVAIAQSGSSQAVPGGAQLAVATQVVDNVSELRGGSGSTHHRSQPMLTVSETTSPIALIELATGDRPLSEDDLETIGIAIGPLASAYSLKKTSTFYKEIVSPLIFETDFSSFMDQIGELLRQAGGMEFFALRNLRDGMLEIVDAWGFEVPVKGAHLSWPAERYEAFQIAASGRIAPVPDVLVGGYEGILATPGLEEIRSFVAAPVGVGGEIYGVLSCGARCPYEFSDIDLLRIEALANSVGVALANYRNINGSVLNLTDLEEMSVAATTAEVAHAARHEVQAVADSARSFARHLYRSKQSKQREEYYAHLERVLDDINPAIDKIRIASRPISYVKTRKGLLAEWAAVTDLMEGRLDAEKIRTLSTGPEIEVSIIEELFRQVFLHLLLNSVDAFRGRGVGTRQPLKQGRIIRLDVLDSGRSRDMVSFQYSDNAIGISDMATRVRVTEDDEDVKNLHRIVRERTVQTTDAVNSLPIEQRIFKPNVTSKGRAGSGWGLYLVRRILDEHGGTIDLTDYRRGVTFTISLPR